MMSFGWLAFASPWLLIALLALPIIWWLLRVTPPAPRFVRFPAIRLLFNIQQKEETPARTPLWLLLLRMVLATLIILAVAHPLLNPAAEFRGTGPVVLVIDNDWTSGRNWNARRQLMLDLIEQAEREQRGVMLLPTAASASPPAAPKLLRAADAREAVQALQPQPWSADHEASLKALGAAQIAGDATVVWLSDNLAGRSTEAFADALNRLGHLRVITDADIDQPLLLRPPVTEGDALVAPIERATGAAGRPVHVQAVAENGAALASRVAQLKTGARTAKVALELPTELRNRVARLVIEGEHTAGAVVLLDERWRRRPVGMVSTGNLDVGQPLLSELYYLDRALSPFAEVRRGSVSDLLARELSVVILPDSSVPSDAERKRLATWVDQGGMLIRFAGPRLAESDDDLVPVKLRRGDRSFGGAMSWTKPVTLAPFEDSSPFAHLATPPDVTVTRQVLAEPSADLGTKTWVRLSDGTPLVTAGRREKGWIVLVHTTANPDWSNLALSGLFVEMLRRMVALSRGVAEGTAEISLPPRELLDGFGRSQQPTAAAVAIPAGAFSQTAVGPRHPPGFYGTDAVRRSLNLSARLPELKPLGDLPGGAEQGSYGAARAVDVKPWLLVAALIVALADLLISLFLRGLVPLRLGRATPAIVVAVALAAAALPSDRAWAESSDPDSFAIAATGDTRLAYVRTGDSAVDEISVAALRGLGAVLRNRTAVEPTDQPIGVNLETDELAFFPVLYWPITAGQQPPSAAASEKLNRYMRTGGVLLFDIRDQGDVGGTGVLQLRRLVQGMIIPPLIPVPVDHVLTKSFYLLQDFPGRTAGGKVWIEQPEYSVHDGVSSIIIGTNDWGGAWAVDANDRPMFPVIPGGEAQREMAYRVGVNIMMYTLTGNYKADQVHIPTILRRLGQ